jgi:hypothetical protein
VLDVHAEQMAAERPRRRDQLLAGTGTLAGLIATCAYWGEERTDAWWLPGITRLVPRGIVGGSKDLIDLRLAPAALLTHAAGAAAAAAGRDELVAHLATGHRVQWQGDVRTAACLFVPDVIWADDADPELRLFERLRPLLQDELALGAAAYTEAWERWALLCYLERYRARVNSPRLPLFVVDGSRAYAPAVVLLRQRVRSTDAGTGLLSHGSLGGAPESAEETITSFETWLAEWADRKDWSRLPPGGGWLDTGPRFPGRPELRGRW